MPSPDRPELTHDLGPEACWLAQAGGVTMLDLLADASMAAFTAALAWVDRHPGAGLRVQPTDLDRALDHAGGRRMVIATVAGWPDRGDDMAMVAEEVAAAAASGAAEIAFPAPSEAISEGDFGFVSDLVEAARTAAPPGTFLTLVLDLRRLTSPQAVTGVARAAIMAGIDRLGAQLGETSSNFEQLAVVLAVLDEAGGKVALEIDPSLSSSGSGSDQRDAFLSSLARVEATLGRDWRHSDRCRFVLDLAAAGRIFDAQGGGQSI